ncbi:hypothetical protein QBC36DRAFT_334841 [Triangularia setosa]|uniref:Uncharacterized protein n=1 Tax=Triangularia setosa TaxID=2587417 RepID=A0AAN6W205_9PEZI|nr:hypothetical protein QBC36DRAFT_334841 [Podospora setosa]
MPSHPPTGFLSSAAKTHFDSSLMMLFICMVLCGSLTRVRPANASQPKLKRSLHTHNAAPLTHQSKFHVSFSTNSPV